MLAFVGIKAQEPRFRITEGTSSSLNILDRLICLESPEIMNPDTYVDDLIGMGAATARTCRMPSNLDGR